MGYFDNQGATATKITWANPTYVPEEQRQNGGWYANEKTGYVDRWWTGDQAGAGNGTGAAGAGTGVTPMGNQPSIDLNALYNQYLQSPEIQDLTNKLKENETKYNEAVSIASDNPFYSAATMQGKIDKIDSKFNREKTAINNQLAIKQADAQLKINLATKQYDIQNEAYKQKFDQYSKLLNDGMMVNASGTDIANMALTLGIPASMIQSVIDKQKKNAAVKPELIKGDNGAYAFVDPTTGAVINQGVVTGGENQTQYPKVVQDNLKNGMSVLEEIDAATNPTYDNTGKAKGDKALSKEEYENAIKRMMGYVKDETIAKQVIDAAWEAGGYNTWNW